MNFNEDEGSLAWLKVLLLSLKTSKEDDENIKKQEEINEYHKKTSV